MLDGDLAWALATDLRFEWEDSDRDLFAPLVDATIMRVGCDELESIARPVAIALWDELRVPIAETLAEQAKRSEFVAEALDDALADLELGPVRSRLANYVVQQGAFDLAEHAFFLDDCLDCIEDGLGLAPPERHPELVGRAAAALALHGAPAFGEKRPDDDERRAARARVRAMAELGLESLPRLAPALRELAAEPLPPLREDGVLQAVMQRRLATIAHLN
jgi:hypothetical protein